MAVQVTDEMVRAYQEDGVVLVKGLFADWVEPLRAGVEANMAAPTSPITAADYSLVSRQPHRFG